MEGGDCFAGFGEADVGGGEGGEEAEEEGVEG